jgi:hypothetical protein
MIDSTRALQDSTHSTIFSRWQYLTLGNTHVEKVHVSGQVACCDVGHAVCSTCPLLLLLLLLPLLALLPLPLLLQVCWTIWVWVLVVLPQQVAISPVGTVPWSPQSRVQPSSCCPA